MREDFDRTVMGMLEDGTLSTLRNTYINLPMSCSTSVSADTDSLSFSQMAGLW